MSSVYVAVFTTGLEKYEFSATILGVFASRKSALNSIIRFLVEDEHMFPELFYDDISSHEVIFGINELIGVENDEASTHSDGNEGSEALPYKQDRVIDHLIEHVDSVKTLERIAKIYNDSYYKEAWDFFIEKQTVRE